MSNPQLAQEWRERLDDFAHSELSVQAWCDFNGVSVYQYYYWRRRLAEPAAQNAANVPNTANGRWQRVEILGAPSAPPATAPLSAQGGIRLHIAGAVLEVEPGFDAPLLRAVVSALAAPSC